MMPLVKQFEHLKIQLDAIKSATNNFADDHCIGKGGFGKVYKGKLVHSKGETIVALKRLNREFGQGDPEFWKEIIMLSLYKHRNIVSLIGFCDDSGEKIVVYEYASKKSLDLYLTSDDLSWVQRLEICIGASRGLAYLHSSVGTQQRVLHRDIKSSNILLDENWNARISDMGLSKFGPANQQYTFLVSNAVGTIGYCDPLYVETGLLTKESDVYSFGVVLFEVLCGRLCIRNDKDKLRPLTGLVRQFYEQNKIDELIYDKIKGEINVNSLEVFTTIAYRCIKRDREARPLMTEIVSGLQTALKYQLGIAKEIQIHDEQDSYERTNHNGKKLHIMRTDREAFDYVELLAAEAEVLGRGSFGYSYKAELSRGSFLVVKRFKEIVIDRRDFHASMMLLGSLSHPNLLPVVACYHDFDEKEMLLITDFAVNGSLASHLYDNEARLHWPTRLKIIKGIARGLDYLYHELSGLLLPHGNLKSSNVLLNDNFNPLLADYALMLITEKEHAQKLMAFKSDEFIQHGRTTKKTDIWCLGILILEIMTGETSTSNLDLKKWVSSIKKEEWTDKVFDKDMKWTKNNEIEMIDLLEIGLHCCESDTTRRWGSRKAIDKILGLKEIEDGDDGDY